jgi:hypothetical protein
MYLLVSFLDLRTSHFFLGTLKSLYRDYYFLLFFFFLARMCNGNLFAPKIHGRVPFMYVLAKGTRVYICSGKTVIRLEAMQTAL